MGTRTLNNRGRIAALAMAVAAVVSACPAEKRPKDEIRRRKMRRVSETIRKRGPRKGKPGIGLSPRRLKRIKIPRRAPPPVQVYGAGPAVFKLLGKGSGRMVQLQYRWKPGLTAVYQGKLEQLTVAPRPLGAFQVAYNFRIRQRARRVESDKVSLGVSLENIQIRYPASIRARAAEVVRKLMSVRFSLDMSPAGKVLGFTMARKVSGAYSRAVQQVSESVARLNPQYPAEPVGTGASWEQTNVFPVLHGSGSAGEPLKSTVVVVYTLEKFVKHQRGEAAVIKFVSRVTLKGKTMGHEVKGSGAGNGSTVVLVDSGLAVEHKGRVKVSTELKEYRSTNTTRLTMNLMTLRVESPPEPARPAARPGPESRPARPAPRKTGARPARGGRPARPAARKNGVRPARGGRRARPAPRKTGARPAAGARPR
jgi:hypothetical protein